MKFSKRPQPVDFGSDGEASGALRPAGEATTGEALGFRPLETPSDDRLPARGAQAHVALHNDDEHVLDLEAEARPPAGWPIWLTALAVSVLWALGPIAFALGYRAKVAPLQDDPFALMVFAQLLPLVVIFLTQLVQLGLQALLDEGFHNGA